MLCLLVFCFFFSRHTVQEAGFAICYSTTHRASWRTFGAHLLASNVATDLEVYVFSGGLNLPVVGFGTTFLPAAPELRDSVSYHEHPGTKVSSQRDHFVTSPTDVIVIFNLIANHMQLIKWLLQKKSIGNEFCLRSECLCRIHCH